MARVTVEDCLDKVDNRFDLILTAAKRAHQLSSGSYRAYVQSNGDKPTVIALREIAEGHIDNTILDNSFDLPAGAGAGVNMAEIEAELSEVVVQEDEIQKSSNIIET